VGKVGQRITGSAGPRTDQCGGPADTVSWTWSVVNGVQRVSGCGPTSSSCVMKAVAATTGGWNSGCILGGSLFGGWESCDSYAVIGKNQFSLRGRVTLEGARDGVSGVRVTATGPGGGSTTTGTDGSYVLVVRRGHFKVTAGSAASPAQRQVHVSHDISSVDFQAPCETITTPAPAQSTGHIRSSAGARAGGGSGPAATVAGGGGACPLTVEIQALDSPITSGLHFDRGDRQPAFFAPFTPGVPSSDGDGFDQACVSGCSNVRLTVTRTNGTTVDGATVKASFDGIGPANAVFPYPRGQSHDPALCVVANEAQNPCGDSITAATDNNGNVFLRVWPPGVVRPACCCGSPPRRTTAPACARDTQAWPHSHKEGPER
jgi:hypothetical protein